MTQSGDLLVWPEELSNVTDREAHIEALEVAIAPSVALLSLVNQVRYGDEAIEINPTFGHSNKITRWFKTDNRDVYIPCSELFQIGMVHGVSRGFPLSVYLHDTYHINLDGINGRKFREVTNDLAQYLYAQYKKIEWPSLLDATIRAVDRDEPYGFTADHDQIAIGLISILSQARREVHLYRHFANWLQRQDPSLQESVAKVIREHETIEWKPGLEDSQVWWTTYELFKLLR